VSIYLPSKCINKICLNYEGNPLRIKVSPTPIHLFSWIVSLFRNWLQNVGEDTVGDLSTDNIKMDVRKKGHESVG
jgi:hypothetical protein